MLQDNVCCAGVTPAMTYARTYLQKAGISLSSSPQWNTKHLLLDIPTIRPGGMTKEILCTLLSSLPTDITVWGGDLTNALPSEYRTVDFLKDEQYLKENASITAQCTIPILEEYRSLPWADFSTLIIGWGRISKALAPLLTSLGSPVTIATRIPDHSTEIMETGYAAANPAHLLAILPQFRCIINTAPAAVLSLLESDSCHDCIKVDLASQKGIEGTDVIWARGLPGKCAPECSGKLIADTFLRLRKEESL